MSAAESLQRLLLIDDDAVFTRVLARALGARGFVVSIAHDAATARALARSAEPHFAVLDLKLGADNGLALIPELRAELQPDRGLLQRLRVPLRGRAANASPRA